MKVLMISIDKGLLGNNPLGDVLERHARYGAYVERLDIIVMSAKGNQVYNISDKVTAYPTNSSNKISYLFDAKRIGRELFSKHNYDLIITQEPFVTGLVGSCLKRKFKSKLLVHFHGDFWQNKVWLKENPLNPLLLLISKWVVSRADAIRVMSQGQKQKLEGLQGKIIEVISTPVDIKKYEREDAESMGLNVLHVGRFDKAKDFETLAKAFELIKEKVSGVTFTQIGGGQEAKAVLPDFVEVLGRTPQNEIIDFYHKASVFVLSSTNESFGKVLVEAFACGVPVVSTNTTGAREIVNDGVDGFLVPIGDAQSLADKTIELLMDSEQAQKFGETGKKMVIEKYGDNTNRIIDLWRKVVQK